jgi:Acetyltransferase (GNAT) family.
VTQVVEISDPAERSRIAESVLRALPEWFGIEEATRKYVDDAATLPTFAAEPDAGFLCVKQHMPTAAEVYVMGVVRGRHRQGIGRALVEAAESWCRARGSATSRSRRLARRGRTKATPRRGRSTRPSASLRSRSCTGCGTR